MLEAADQMRQLHFFDESLVDTMMEGIDKTTMGSLATGDYINKLIGAVIVALVAAAVYKRTKMPTDIIN